MIDLTKPIRRKIGGEPVRILAIDAPSPVGYGEPRPIVFITSDGRLERKTLSYMEQIFENIPEDKFLWLNVYDNGCISYWKSIEEADTYANKASPKRKFLLKLNINSGETTIERKF